MAPQDNFEFQRFKTEMGVSVIKQLVSLEIDAEHQKIIGCTDLCLVPHGSKIHDIRLNCRQCEITSVTVNDVPARFSYYDFMDKVVYDNARDLKSYYTLLRGSLADGELIIEVPENVYFSSLKRDSYVNYLYSIKPKTDKVQFAFEDFSATSESPKEFPDIPDFHLPDISSKIWSHIYQHNPIQVQIHYQITKPETGIFFRSNPTPHVYTWNSFFAGKQEESLGNSTRTWVPCIDNDLERCQWELEISVPSNYFVKASGSLQPQQHNRKLQRSIFVFSSSTPLSASSIGFVAGEFTERVEKDSLVVVGAIDHAHQYMLSYTLTVAEKAIHYLDSVFSSEFTNHSSILSTVTIAAVVEPPEPYCVCNDLILIDRNELIGEKDFSHINEFYHMICFCLAYQYYGILIQPLAWSDSWICIGISSFLGLEFIGDERGEDNKEYLYYRFKQASFFIEDQISLLPNDQSGRSTITNNRPLAVGNGAIFLSNSPFFTSLLFVKSPIVTSLISQQSASIVRMAFRRLDDQSIIQQDLYSLLPVAKMISLRILTLPDSFMIPALVSNERSIIKRPSSSLSSTIQESLSQTNEEFLSKKQKIDGMNHDLADSMDASTPVLKTSSSRSILLTSPPSFSTLPSNPHVSFKSDGDDMKDSTKRPFLLSSRSSTIDDNDDRNSVGSNTTEGCTIKTKTSVTCTNPYDACDPSMYREHATIPLIPSSQIPLCYADGRILPSNRRDCGKWDPDFDSVDHLKNVVTNLSTESFMKLITENLAFTDDNFQTVMVERNGYDKFYLQYQFKKVQKEVILDLTRLNHDAVNKSEIVVERNEGTGIHLCELRLNDNENHTEVTFKLAKSHKQDNEVKSIKQIPYCRPDPYHSWYATFTVTQTLRMWMSQFENSLNIQDRIAALQSMEYFQQPPEKKVFEDPNKYTKKHALLDYIKEKGLKIEDFKKQKKSKSDKKGKQPEKRPDEIDINDIVIPKEFDKEAKRRMMDYHQYIKHEKTKQEINPDEGPVDVYAECIVGSSSIDLIEESILAMVFWEVYSPPDDRPSIKDLAKNRLFSIFNEYYRYQDKNLCPVNYDHEESMRRRSLITGLALFRDEDYTPPNIFDFIVDQLVYHDYVSNPQVYDADEEYVAAMLYSLSSLQTFDMVNSLQQENQPGQLSKCHEIIQSFLTYPSPSFKGKVLIAALYTESVFEMHHRFEPSSIFLKYTNPSYPVPVRCEAYHCLTRILLRNEESKSAWASSFSWIFKLALQDPHPSVVVSFLHYLINPETLSPFVPITEFYLNTTRKNQPSLPSFTEESNEGILLAEQVWTALSSPSRYNHQLRKLLFILYKQLFGIDIPKVYGNKVNSLAIVQLNFNGTPLDLYPAMVNTIYIDKGKETPIIERERKVDSRMFKDKTQSIKVRVSVSAIHRFLYVCLEINK